MTPAPGRLLQILGVGFGIAVIIGNTIGAGILRAPGEVARQLPDPWLFMGAWAIGGLYALLGAIQIAELGAMLPRSGGQYVFSRHALGEYAQPCAGGRGETIVDVQPTVVSDLSLGAGSSRKSLLERVTTLVVFGFVVVMGLFFWVLDLTLAWATKFLSRQGG